MPSFVSLEIPDRQGNSELSDRLVKITKTDGVVA